MKRGRKQTSNRNQNHTKALVTGLDFRRVPYHLHPLLLTSLPAGIVIIESKHTRTRNQTHNHSLRFCNRNIRNRNKKTSKAKKIKENEGEVIQRFFDSGAGKGYNSVVECHLDMVEVISSSLIIPKPNLSFFFYLLPHCD